jgi:ABC-type antimicrobial peptide transport system permease subunit
MRLRDVIAIGIAQILQNRLRAGLSILGIFIGVTSVLCMTAIGDGAKRLIEKDIEARGGANQVRFWTRTAIWKHHRFIKPTTERYTSEDAIAIEAGVPDVRFVLPQNHNYESLVTHKDGSQARPHLEGVTADYAIGMYWQVQAGRFLSEDDIVNAAQVCVLGADTARELFGNASALGQEVKIRYHWGRSPVRMWVVGVMKPKGRSLNYRRSFDNTICVPLTTHQQRFSGNRFVENLVVFHSKDIDIQSLITSVKEVLRTRHRGKDDFISYWLPTSSVRQLEHIQKVIQIALAGISGFSLFVSGIGIMNICLVSVGEKTREIGLRKSVGARWSDVFWQFLTESIALCFCGGILGIVGGWLAAHGMARLAVYIVPIVPEWPVVLSGPWILISLIFSVFMGIIFGVYPAMRAARLAPIDALRTET